MPLARIISKDRYHQEGTNLGHCQDTIVLTTGQQADMVIFIEELPLITTYYEVLTKIGLFQTVAFFFIFLSDSTNVMFFNTFSLNSRAFRT